MVVAYLKFYPGICVQGLSKTTKTLSLGNRCLGRDSNKAPSEYKLTASPLPEPVR
jgi:hypothetical protein